MNRRRRSHGSSSRDYPRTARVNELLREIIGDELERIDEPQLEWVSITGVTVNPELTSAMVYFSSLDPETDPEVLAALGDRRVRLQAAIARQARLRRTPELHFQPDSGIREGWRVEEIFKEIGPLPDGEPDAVDEADGDGHEPGHDPEAGLEDEQGAVDGASPGTGD